MKKKYPWWLAWQTWTIAVTLTIVCGFTFLEKDSEIRQPSEKWSMAIDLDTNITLDHRAIDVVPTNSENSAVFAQLNKGALEVFTIDSKANIGERTSLKMPIENAKVLKLNQIDAQINALISDRETLWQVPVQQKSSKELNFGEPRLIHSSTEQFDAVGSWLIAGDDNDVELIYKDRLIETISGYNNLRNIIAIQSEDEVACYFVVDADSGSTLYQYDLVKGLRSVKLGTPQDKKQYGMIRDMKLVGDQLTLASHKYNHLDPSSPTVIGIWHYNVSKLEKRGVYYYYHVATSLEPQLIQVSGDTVDYVLGMSQTISLTGEMSRYPQTESGKIVNISHLKRQGDTLIVNERVTLTRDYPIFYKSFELEGQSVLFWVDRRAGEGHLRMAGASESMISIAKSRVQVDWITLVMSAVMGIGNSLVIGLMYAMIMLLDAKIAIIAAVLFLFLFHRFAPLPKDKRGQFVFYLAVLITAGVKWYVYGFAAPDFKHFAYVYPLFFGTPIVMQLAQIITTGISFGIYWLWHKQHPYYKNRWLHFGMYFSLELALLLMTSIALFMNAMMKVKFMM